MEEDVASKSWVGVTRSIMVQPTAAALEARGG